MPVPALATVAVKAFFMPASGSDNFNLSRRADASQVDGVSRRALRVVYDKVAIDVRWRADDGVGIGAAVNWSDRRHW